MATANTDYKHYAVQGITRAQNHLLNVKVVCLTNSKTDMATIDLDSILGNVNGALSLGHTDFSHGAKVVKWDAPHHTLTAELVDLNNYPSLSSITIECDVGSIEDKLALHVAYGAPHSMAHSEAENVNEADNRILKMFKVTPGSPAVTHVKTIDMNHDFGCGQ